MLAQGLLLCTSDLITCTIVIVLRGRLALLGFIKCWMNLALIHNLPNTILSNSDIYWPRLKFISIILVVPFLLSFSQ
jgi:hypothetical protein